jgi:hypothetical protein
LTISLSSRLNQLIVCFPFELTHCRSIVAGLLLAWL